MKKAVIYLKAVRGQTYERVAEQLRICNNFARANNYMIIGECIERYNTIISEKSDDFLKLAVNCEKQLFSAVITSSDDSFSYTGKDHISLKKELKKTELI